MALNEKYSHKDFTQKILTGTDPAEWNDTEVVNSCFYNEKPNTQVFPDGIEGVRFIRCNLDNVIVPETCEIEGGCHRLIQVQNDLEDWILDKDLHPIEPVNKPEFVKLGLSIDPANIPPAPVEVPVTQTKRLQLENTLAAQKADLDAAADLAWRK